MDDRVILRIGAKILMPFIMVFALYVQFHGDYGPGGGFQAGVILSSAFVLYGLVFGLENVQRVLPPIVPHTCAAVGALIYIGTGFLTVALGGTFLEYGALVPEHPVDGQHWGILMIELGVVTTVFGVMVGLFYAFAGRRRS
jgi:multicomponent Na+:H+ antiporter subunit B